MLCNYDHVVIFLNECNGHKIFTKVFKSKVKGQRYLTPLICL